MKKILRLLLLLFTVFWNSASIMAAVPLHRLPGGHAALKHRVAPPVAVSDDYSVAMNTTLQVTTANGVMANDVYDAGLVPGLDLIMEQATSPQHGNVLINQDGSFDYIPNPGYVGDDNFDYYIGYSGGPSNTATVTIHVKQPPVTVNDDYNAIMNTTLTVNLPQGVMQNDIYDAGLVPGQDLIMQQATAAQHGTVTIHGDGTFSYTPNADYVGDDAFNYYIGYSLGPSNVSTVTIHVKQPAVVVETLPVAMTTTYGTAATAVGFNISGTNLSGDITVRAPIDFEVSADGGATFGVTAIVAATAHQVNTTNILVRLKAGTNAGTYSETIIVSSQDANLAFAIIPSSTVNQLSVTVQPDNTTKVYGNADPVLTYTATPALVGRDVFHGALTRSPGENVNSYAISAGSLSLSANYSLTVSPGTFTITPRPTTVSGTTQSKIYGDVDPALTYSASPALQPGDAFTGALSRDPGENVGSYATNLGTLSAGSNYSLVFVPGSLRVTSKSVTVTADAQTKTYGNADPALTYTVAPSLVTGDAFTGSLTRTAGENVGNYAISLGSLSPGSNYTVTFNGNNLSIVPQNITVTADAQSKTYGDADPALTYVPSPSPLPGDAFTGGLTRAPGEDVGSYAISLGSLSLGSNYTITFTGNNLSIGTKAITVTADAQSKTYGDADPALTYTASPSLVPGDAFTGSLTRAPGEDVGNYAISQGSLALSTNYVLNFTGSNLTIGTKVVNVTADAQSKYYGDADPALTYTVSPSLVPGDAFAGSLTRAPGEHVGNYAISQGSLALNANYVLNFTGSNLTIGTKVVNVTADAQSKTYGDADPALTYTVSPSLVPGDAFTGSLTRAPGEDVGNYAISQGSLALSTNYVLNFTGNDLVIGTKAISVTADAQSKHYGDADPALTYTFTPALVPGDAFTGSLTRAPGEDVGNYAISQGSLALSANYILNFTGNNLTIGTKVVNVTADAQSKHYGDADPALTYTISPALVPGDAFSGSVTRAPGEDVGTYAISQGSLALSANYVLNFTGNDLVIGTKAISVTADAQSKTYGDADPALTYTVSPSLVPGDAFAGSLTRAPGEHVGTYAISQGSLSLGSNYVLNFTGSNLAIGAKTINVTADPKTKARGTADPVFTYTYTPALVTGDVFTGSLTRDPGESVGIYPIRLGTLTPGSDYLVNYTGDNLTISAKVITVTATAQGKTYGDADPALTYTFTPALDAGDAFSGTLSRAPGEAVGSYAINQGSLTLPAQYVIVFNSANLSIGQKTIAVAADAQTKTYGDADPTLTYTFTPSLVTGDAFTGSLARAAGENVGSYIISQGTLALSSNYQLTFTGAQLSITPKAITVTADAQAKEYGASDPAFTYTHSPALVGSDAFTGTLTRDPGENVGSYAIRQGTLALGSNYTLSFVTANLNIGVKTITVTAQAQSKTYGDADPALTYTYTPALTGTDGFTGALARDPGENAGSYAIKQGTLALSSNYVVVYNGDNLVISPKAITVTADAKSKAYGAADPALTYTSAPALLGSDAFTGSLTRAAGENVGIYAISQGSLSAGGNYAITFTGNDFTITKKTVNVTAEPKQKSYGDADPALTYTFAPALVPGDVFTGSLTRDAGENVGNYAINLGTLSLNGNYTITFTGADLTIGAKQIDVTATAMSKTYGDADPVLTYTVAQALIPGDAFTGTLTRAPGENAGVYPILQGSLTLGGNYVLHFTSADFTINKKTITITADAASKTYGDADPVLTYTFTPAPAPGDQFGGSLSRAPGENVGAYAINLGTLALNANYDLAFNSADLTIGQRAITVAAKSATKVYGAADPVLGYALTAGTLVAGDVFTGSLTRDAGENVGNYTIRQGTLTPGNNYAMTFTVNVFIITKATLTITADAQTKVYGAADPVLTYQATGFQRGDDNNLFTGTLTRDPGENAGVYAILQGTVAAGNNYTLVYNGNNLTITKAPQAITWNQQLISGCGGTDLLQLNATASSGLPVTYTVANVNVATVSGDILTPVAQGGTVVTATQPGDANHEAAAPVDNNFSYQLSGLVRPHWDDVLVFDNSSNDYVQWQWYKDGNMINGATMAYYSQPTSLSGTYYVVVKDKNGNTSQTCPVTLTAPATATGGIRIQPNPAPAGATATITCNYTDAALQGAKLTITSITGGVLKEIAAVHPTMQVSMPNTGGLYIISLRLSNGQIASVNVMIAD